MRRKPQMLDRGPGFQMAPMIDVVFLLLIFFMCSSSLRSPERLLELQGADLDNSRSGTLDMSVELTVESDGEVVFNGLRLAPGDAGLTVLEERLSFLGRNPDGQASVVVRASRKAPYQQVVDVLAVCARTGVRELTVFSTSSSP